MDHPDTTEEGTSDLNKLQCITGFGSNDSVSELKSRIVFIANLSLNVALLLMICFVLVSIFLPPMQD